MQDINTIIADFVNAAVERKVKEEMANITNQIEELHNRITDMAGGGGTALGHIIGIKHRLDTIEMALTKVQLPTDRVMDRLSYIERSIAELPNEASIKQMIEDEIGESQQKVEDIIDEKIDEKLGTDLEDTVKEKIEQRLDDELEDAVMDALDSAINDGKITLTFMR